MSSLAKIVSLLDEATPLVKELVVTEIDFVETQLDLASVQLSLQSMLQDLEYLNTQRAFYDARERLVELNSEKNRSHLSLVEGPEAAATLSRLSLPDPAAS